MFYDNKLKESGIQYDILRNNQLAGTTYGRPFQNRLLRTSSQPPVLEGDVLIDKTTGKPYNIESVDPILNLHGKVEGWQALYAVSNQTEGQTINIGAIHGQAVVGSQQNVTLHYGASITELRELIASKPVADQAELNELAATIENSKEIKPGMLSRFGKLLEKHSDLAVIVGKIYFEILTHQNSAASASVLK